jgi:hypothetical protein
MKAIIFVLITYLLSCSNSNKDSGSEQTQIQGREPQVQGCQLSKIIEETKKKIEVSDGGESEFYARLGFELRSQCLRMKQNDLVRLWNENKI